MRGKKLIVGLAQGAAVLCAFALSSTVATALVAPKIAPPQIDVIQPGAVSAAEDVLPDRLPLPRFKISGSVQGLYPGAQRTLTLALRNPNPIEIEVHRLTAKVKRDANPGCSKDLLEISSFEGAVLIPAKSTVQLQLDVSLSREAPDSCRGASFPVRYEGLGRIPPLPTEVP